MDLKRAIADQLEAVVGSHDETEHYAAVRGDPGLIGPDSISWEINGDMGSIAVAGLAAIVMEILHPSVMAGVEGHSSYRTDPLRRARTTMGYVLRTTFATTESATALVERVRRIHGRVNGDRPDGTGYRALDPDLIAWVHTCIPWAVMTAFERYNRPLTTGEKDRYLAEQAVIGRMGGADHVPESVAELDAYVERVRPQLALTEQTRSFIAFLCGDTGDERSASAGDQLNRRAALKASMLLMPAWARRLTGLELSPLASRVYGEPHNRVVASLVRWGVGTPACKRLAMERMAAASDSHDSASSVSPAWSS